MTRKPWRPCPDTRRGRPLRIDRDKRAAIIDRAVDDYVAWVTPIPAVYGCARKGRHAPVALLLGYALHGVEEPGVHAGIPMASTPRYANPDYGPRLPFPPCMRGACSTLCGTPWAEGFDRLRITTVKESLSPSKNAKGMFIRGVGLDGGIGGYRAAGKKYLAIKRSPNLCAGPEVCCRGTGHDSGGRIRYVKAARRSSSGALANPGGGSSPQPLSPLAKPAQWTVPRLHAETIESRRHRVRRLPGSCGDQAGRLDRLRPFLVQTDDATGTRATVPAAKGRTSRRTGSSGSTAISIPGDQDTRRFRAVGAPLFPAKRTALVLWGAWQRHDDQNVYRAIRGSVSPRWPPGWRRGGSGSSAAPGAPSGAGTHARLRV